MAAAPAVLIEALEEARDRGFLGPGPVEEHVLHAERLLEGLPAEGVIGDLGSGGGVPALVLALARPALTWVLIEARERRAVWLREAAARLGMGDRVEVRNERAEVSGRSALRGSLDAVTARGFGPPATTAECGAPLLRPEGVLWVAEPPDPDPARWPAPGIALLGLAVDRRTPSWVGLRQVAECPDRYPRRDGVPAKQPLF